MNQQDKDEQGQFTVDFSDVPVASAGRLPMWTIPMCCVWAATRDTEAVAHVELHDPDAAQWLFEDGSIPFWHGAHVLAWQSLLLVNSGHLPLPDLAVALFQLQEYAARGTVAVRGKRLGDGVAEAIPADAWADLQIVTWSAPPGFVAAPEGIRAGVWWSHLRVLPDELLKIWPRVPIPTPLDAKRSTEIATAPVPIDRTVLASSPWKVAVPPEDDKPEVITCETIVAWTKPIIKKIEVADLQLTRTQFIEMVEHVNGVGVPKKIILEAWAKVASEEWRKQGRGNVKAAMRVLDWRVYLDEKSN
jgi:hypothetical protein